jgi:hypothetical protein
MNGLLFFPNYPQIHLSNNPATRFLSGWVGQKNAGGGMLFGSFPRRQNFL